MTTALATVDGEVIEDQQPITLFGTTDPVAVVERASTVATALADVLKQKHLVSRIGNRDHVQVEGWTLLGSMLGVFAEVEWTHEVTGGWEARAVARTLAGKTVGAAEAMCTKSERTWSNRDDYAIRSMAQTRAVSKALRHPLGFIVELAGYSATPAEELNDEPGRAGNTEAQPRRPAPADSLRMELAQLLHDKHLDEHVAGEYATLYGVVAGTRATDDQMRQIIEAVRTHGSAQELVIPQAAEPVAASPSVAPAIPPKPRTDEYLALDATDKAAARAYWAEQAKAERERPPLNPEQEVLELAAS